MSRSTCSPVFNRLPRFGLRVDQAVGLEPRAGGELPQFGSETLVEGAALGDAAPGGAAARRDDSGSQRAASTNPARTEALIPSLSSLAKVVASGARVEKSEWLWLALAAVLGAVLMLAGAAIVMRQQPQYLPVASPEAQLEPARQQPANIAQQEPSPNSSAPAASVAPGSQSMKQSGAKPANHGPDASSPAAPDMARAAMLIASDNPRNPVVSLGSTVWSTIPPAPGHPATVAVKADAYIPDLKMHATIILRKNTDPILQATHTIDLKFSFSHGAPITGIKDVEPKMRNLGPTASESLKGVRVKISDVYFLIALANGDQDAAHNLNLMQTRAWFDFPLLLNKNRIAKLVFQKSTKGEAMLAKAFEAWK